MTMELAVVIEISSLCQHLVTSSGRFIWIEKKRSVLDAKIGDTIKLVLKQTGWQRRWHGVPIATLN